MPVKHAMVNGLMLGGFWVIKYILFIGGTAISWLGVVNVALSPLTIFFTYILTKAYKILLGGQISFKQAFGHILLLYFFASLIEALPQYIFFRYIASPEYMQTMIEQAAAILKSISVEKAMEQDVIDQFSALTPINLTFQGILTNVFYGIILGIPIAGIICRKAIDPGKLETE
jgi:hypothetical protein